MPDIFDQLAAGQATDPAPQAAAPQQAAPPQAAPSAGGDIFDQLATGSYHDPQHEPVAAKKAEPEKSSAVGRYVEGLVGHLHVPTTEDIKGALPGIATTLVAPELSAVKQVYDYGKHAYQGAKEGNQDIMEAGQNIRDGQPILPNLGKAAAGMVHSQLSAVPIVGQDIENMGQKIAAKNYAGAAGEAGSVIAKTVGAEAAGRVAGARGRAQRVPV